MVAVSQLIMRVNKPKLEYKLVHLYSWLNKGFTVFKIILSSLSIHGMF